MNDGILNFIEEEYEVLGLDDKAKELVALFIEDIMKHENVTMEQISSAGSRKD